MHLRGSKGIRYLVMDPVDGEADGYGHVISKHKKLSAARTAVDRRRKASRLNGQRCNSYIYDLKTERKVPDK